jgi:hypothetical protein
MMHHWEVQTARYSAVAEIHVVRVEVMVVPPR